MTVKREISPLVIRARQWKKEARNAVVQCNVLTTVTICRLFLLPAFVVTRHQNSGKMQGKGTAAVAVVRLCISALNATSARPWPWRGRLMSVKVGIFSNYSRETPRIFSLPALGQMVGSGN